MNRLGSLSGAGKTQLRFQFRCVDARAAATFNTGRPSLFSSMNGATITGGWGGATALWKGLLYLDANTNQTPMTGCWTDGPLDPHPAPMVPSYVWSVSPNAGRDWVESSYDVTANPEQKIFGNRSVDPIWRAGFWPRRLVA